MMRDEKVYNRNKDLYFYADAVRKCGLENYMSGFFASPDFYKTVSNIFAKYPERKYHTHFDVTGDLGAGDEYLCDVPIGVSETWLKEVCLKPDCFITIDTGLNQEYALKSNVRAWKCEYWDRLAQMIRERYPQFKIVQMGLATGEDENISADCM